MTALAVFLLAPPPASAYVRYLSDSGCPYSWQTRSIALTGYSLGLTSDVSFDDIDAAVGGAVTTWSRNALACTDLDLQLTMRREAPPAAAKYDHVNNIMFQNTWGCMPTDNGYSECRDANALAITSVFATKWGQIVDADIEVNTVNFTWSNLDTAPAGNGTQDLQNALTHEMGHFIGLDHTCYGDTTRARPRDQNGQLIPDCGSVADDDPVHATTMFASADPGDVSKRSLEPDDQQGVCDIYPAGAQDFLVCSAPEMGGCAIGGATSARAAAAWQGGPDWRNWAGAGTIALVLTTLAGARRLRRRRR